MGVILGLAHVLERSRVSLLLPSPGSCWSCYRCGGYLCCRHFYCTVNGSINFRVDGTRPPTSRKGEAKFLDVDVGFGRRLQKAIRGLNLEGLHGDSFNCRLFWRQTRDSASCPLAYSWKKPVLWQSQECPFHFEKLFMQRPRSMSNIIFWIFRSNLTSLVKGLRIRISIELACFFVKR